MLKIQKLQELLYYRIDMKAAAFKEFWEANFVSIEQELIIAPYDGGVDFILKSSDIRDHYKHKYSSWLSLREDGF